MERKSSTFYSYFKASSEKYVIFIYISNNLAYNKSYNSKYIYFHYYFI